MLECSITIPSPLSAMYFVLKEIIITLSLETNYFQDLLPFFSLDYEVLCWSQVVHLMPTT